MSATHLSTNKGIFPLLEDDALSIDTMVENFLISNHKETCKPLASRICITALRALEHFKDRNQAREEMNKMFNLMFFPKIKDIALLYATRTSNVVFSGEEQLLTHSRKTHYTREAELVQMGDFEAIIRLFKEETYERLSIDLSTAEEESSSSNARPEMTKMGTLRDVQRLMTLFEKRFFSEIVIDALLPAANRFQFQSPAVTSQSIQDNK